MTHPNRQTRARRVAVTICAAATVAAALTVAAAARAQPADSGLAASEVWQAFRASLAPQIGVTHHELEIIEGDRVVASSVRFAATAPDASQGALTVGRLELRGPGDPDVPGSVADSIVMHDVLFRPGGSGVGRIETLTIEGPGGLAALLQALVALPDPDDHGEDPTTGIVDDADPEPSDGALEALASALDAIALQSVTAEGITTVERRGRTRQQTLSLDRLEIGPVAGGVVASVMLEGMVITDRSPVGVDRVELRDLDVGRWLATATGAEDGDIPALSLVLDPGIGSVAVDGFEMLGQDGSPLVALTGARFQLMDEAGIGGANILMDRLSFPVSTIDDATAETALRDLGYVEIQASVDVTLALDEAAETLTVGPIRLDLAEMAAIDVEFVLGRFDLETLIRQAQAMARTGIPQLPPTTLDAASIVVTDASLTGRLIQRAASASGLTTGEVVAAVLAEVSATADDWDLEGAPRTMLLDAVEAFLTVPGTLTIEAAPDRPVTLLEAGLGAIAGPGALFERLNVAITTQ